MSVRPSVCLNLFGRSMIFSASFQDNCPKFNVRIPLANEHLFYDYIVRLWVGNSIATYERTRHCYKFNLVCH